MKLVGCPPKWKVHFREVEQKEMSETHQCLGDESILVGSTVLPRVLSRKDNSNHE